MRPVTLLLLLAVSSSPVLAQDFATTRIAEGVYQFRFQSHNGFMVVTDDGVVVVDPISTLAASRFAAEIKRVAPGARLRAVVYSHDHADHATGARVLMDAFGERVPVIAQDHASAKLVDAGPDLPAPDVTFTDRMTLHFGGRAIELYYLGKSHSDNMLVVLVPDVRVAFAVDFVSNDRVGYQDLPDYHFPDFYGALERLMTLEFDTIVFGHGPAGDPAAVRRQGQYYGSLRAAVQQAIDNGWTEDEAAERVRLPQYESWGQYEAWFPMNVRAIYRSLVTGR
jgi:glyoxylase-like metal-dependent hydrolase (beta-lactamase superfamily II)